MSTSTEPRSIQRAIRARADARIAGSDLATAPRENSGLNSCLAAVWTGGSSVIGHRLAPDGEIDDSVEENVSQSSSTRLTSS